MLLFFVLTVLCFLCAYICDFEMRIYKKYGMEQRARIISFNKRKVRETGIRSPYITWYHLLVETKSESGNSLNQMISTQNRKAKKYANEEYADIIILNPQQVRSYNVRYCIIKEDMKSSVTKIFSLLSGSVFFVLFVLTLIGYVV